MECLKCKTKKVCKIYDMKLMYQDDVVMNITNCNFKEKPIYDKQTTDFSSYSTNSLKEQFDEEEYQRFLKKQNGIVEEVKDEIMTCPTCGGQDYSNYITICSKCGSTVCGNCSTNDEGLTYCNKCWEEV